MSGCICARLHEPALNLVELVPAGRRTWRHCPHEDVVDLAVGFKVSQDRRDLGVDRFRCLNPRWHLPFPSRQQAPPDRSQLRHLAFVSNESGFVEQHEAVAEGVRVHVTRVPGQPTDPNRMVKFLNRILGAGGPKQE